jgi:hypothetical protein
MIKQYSSLVYHRYKGLHVFGKVRSQYHQQVETAGANLLVPTSRFSFG